VWPEKQLQITPSFSATCRSTAPASPRRSPAMSRSSARCSFPRSATCPSSPSPPPDRAMARGPPPITPEPDTRPGVDARHLSPRQEGLGTPVKSRRRGRETAAEPQRRHPGPLPEEVWALARAAADEQTPRSSSPWPSRAVRPSRVGPQRSRARRHGLSRSSGAGRVAHAAMARSCGPRAASRCSRLPRAWCPTRA
jgi:hypothetical protein